MALLSELRHHNVEDVLSALQFLVSSDVIEVAGGIAISPKYEDHDW